MTLNPSKSAPSGHWEEFKDAGYLTPMINGSLEPFEGYSYLYDAFNPAARNATWQSGFMNVGWRGAVARWMC